MSYATIISPGGPISSFIAVKVMKYTLVDQGGIYSTSYTGTYNDMSAAVNDTSNERGSCAALASGVAEANVNFVFFYR